MSTKIFFLLLFAKQIIGQNDILPTSPSNQICSPNKIGFLASLSHSDVDNSTCWIALGFLCPKYESTEEIPDTTLTLSRISTITTRDTKITTMVGNTTTVKESTKMEVTTPTTTASVKTEDPLSTANSTTSSIPMKTETTTSHPSEMNTSSSVVSSISTTAINTQTSSTIENKSTEMGVSTTTTGIEITQSEGTKEISTGVTKSEGSKDIPTGSTAKGGLTTKTEDKVTTKEEKVSTTGTKRTTNTVTEKTTTNTKKGSTEKETKKSTSTGTTIPSIPTTKVSTRTSSISYTTTKKVTTTPGYCDDVCPEGYTEGMNYCVRLATDTYSYSLAIGSCQSDDYGDILTEADLTNEYEAIQKILIDQAIPYFHLFVNEFSSSLLRQNRSVRVFFLSASSSILTSPSNITKPNTKTTDTLALCKTPKHCARPNCTTIGMLKEAPKVQFVTQPPDVLTYGQSVKLQCTNKTSTSPIFTSSCSDRGNMQPPPVLLQSNCDAVTVAKDNSEDDYDDPKEMITCDMCLDRGTIDCIKGNGTTDKCNCKEGWKGNTCYRSPKFCPNMTCDKGAVCVERVDHALCQCVTEECTTLERTKGRDPTAISFTTSVKGVATAVPLFILVVKVIVKIVTASPVETIQDTVVNHRSFMLTINGIIYCLFADPTVLNLEAAERRFWCLAFHFTSLAVLAMYYLECSNINDVVHGKSRNHWFTKSSEGRRWDYGYAMFFAYVSAAILSITLWFFQWDNQQAPWTSIGSFDNFGMAGWMAVIYVILAVAIAAQAEIAALYYKQDKTKQLHLDNHYDTTDPCLADEVNMVIRNRNIAPFVVLLQALYFICMVLAIDMPTVLMTQLTFGVSIVNTLFSVYQSVYASELLGTVIAIVQMLFPTMAPVYNEYTFRTTRETLACFWKKKFVKFEKGEEEKKKTKEEKQVDKAQKARDAMIQTYPDCPLLLLPSLVLAGPNPMRMHTYDLMDKWYIPARMKEFTMIRWTRLYLSVRVKCCVTVADSLEFVRQYLSDAEFFDGAYCTPREAMTMYAEWQSMMVYQDKLDYEPMKKSEKAKLLAAHPKEFYDEISSMCLQNKVNSAPEDPKKKRLLTPVMTLFLRQPDIRCPTILGRSMDEFGLITSQLIVRDVPCITRRQEEEKYALFKEAMKEENEKWDKVYEDDQFIVDQKEGPNEEMIRQTISISPSHRETQATKSLNPRKDVNAVNDFWLNKNRPDFIGPRLPRDSLPLGPLYNRFNLFLFYEEIKEAKWKEHLDQMAQYEWNREERQKNN